MSHNYLLADMISRIKNAQLVKKKYVVVNFSNLVFSVLNLLFKNGYILKFEKFIKSKNIFNIRVFIKYTGVFFIPIIKEFNVISKPGRRIFIPYKRLKDLHSILGTTVISTSKGLISSSRAKYLKLGGEVLFNIF